jgi:hypothetical protein
LGNVTKAEAQTTLALCPLTTPDEPKLTYWTRQQLQTFGFALPCRERGHPVMLTLALVLPVVVWTILAFLVRHVSVSAFLRFIIVALAGIIFSGLLFASFYPVHQAGPFIVFPFAASSLVAAVVALYVLRR